MPAWQARRVAQQTRRLPLTGARWVDEQLASRGDGACGPVIVDRLVAQLTATADPEAQQEAEEAAQAGWDVTISHADPALFAGTSHVDLVGDTATLQEMHDLVVAIAHQLWLEGDESPLGVRKIKALRLIVRGSVARSASERTDKIRFYVHVEAHDLEPQPPGEDVYAVGRIEKLGAATMARLRQWVGHHQITFVPVLNMQRGDAVDVHDPPVWMRELVILRDGHCVFPRCTRDARSCDLDHITPYDPDGPPGQTRPDNLACLCRRHHRAKTAVSGATAARPTATTAGAGRTAPRTSSHPEAALGSADLHQPTAEAPPARPIERRGLSGKGVRFCLLLQGWSRRKTRPLPATQPPMPRRSGSPAPDQGRSGAPLTSRDLLHAWSPSCPPSEPAWSTRSWGVRCWRSGS